MSQLQPHSYKVESTTNETQIPIELVQPLLIAAKAAILDRPQWIAFEDGWWDIQGQSWLKSLDRRLGVQDLALPTSPTVSEAQGLSGLFPCEQHDRIVRSLLSLCLLPPTNEEHSTKTATPVLYYTASTRAFLARTLEILSIPLSSLLKAEDDVSHDLYHEMKRVEMHSKAEATRKENENGFGGKWGRWAATAGGTILGGIAIGLTAGAALPALAFLPLLTASTAPAVLGTVFGLTGGGLAGYRVNQRWAGVDEFDFIQVTGGGEEGETLPDAKEKQGVPLQEKQAPSLVATIVIPGILLESRTEGVEAVRSCAGLFTTPRRDLFVLSHSTETMLKTGQTLDGWVKSQIVGKLTVEVLKRTALSAVLAAVALPVEIYKKTGMVTDNEWIRGCDRARKAGKLLANVLREKIQGERPVTLIGTSLGALVLFQALLELSADGHDKPPLVDSAILVSLPIAPRESEWANARSVVSRRLVNAYCEHDLVLAGVGRLHEILGGARVGSLAGLSRTDESIQGIENIDLGNVIEGHFDLNRKMADVLKAVKVDVEVSWHTLNH